MKIFNLYLGACVAVLSLSISSVFAADSHFGKVPADTPVYLGTTESTPWLTTLTMSSPQALHEFLEQLESEVDEDDQNRVFLRVIAQALLQGGKDKQSLIAQPGRIQFYLQGIVPVLRLELSSAGQFRKRLVQDGETNSPSLVVEENEGHELWLAKAGTQASDFFAAIDGEDLVVARYSHKTENPSYKAIIEGTGGFDPEVSLFPAKKDYALSGDTVAWFDLQQLRDNVVNEDSALHAAMRDNIQDQAAWQQFLGPECQHDVSRFVDNTPHLIADAEHRVADNQNAIDGAFVWPLRDSKAQAAWQALQGEVLQLQADASPFQLGLGLDGQGTAAYIQYLTSDLAALQCPLWRDKAAQFGVAMAMGSSMSAMFSSVKGITVQLFDLSLDANKNPDPQSVDAQVTVLTDNPSLLLLMLRSTLPLPAVIPEDGTPITIQTPIGVPLQLAVYPHSINLYKGEKASHSVAALKKEMPTKAALFDMGIDTIWALLKSESLPESVINEMNLKHGTPAFSSMSIRHLPYGLRSESTMRYVFPASEDMITTLKSDD